MAHGLGCPLDEARALVAGARSTCAAAASATPRSRCRPTRRCWWCSRRADVPPPSPAQPPPAAHPPRGRGGARGGQAARAPRAAHAGRGPQPAPPRLGAPRPRGGAGPPAGPGHQRGDGVREVAGGDLRARGELPHRRRPQAVPRRHRARAPGRRHLHPPAGAGPEPSGPVAGARTRRARGRDPVPPARRDGGARARGGVAPHRPHAPDSAPTSPPSERPSPETGSTAGRRRSGTVPSPARCLHAHVLLLPHPRTGRPLRLVAPLPDDLAPFLAALDVVPPEEGA